MKRIALLTLMLLIGIASFASCADLIHSVNTDSSVAALDKLEAEFVAVGYDSVRYSESEVITFTESLVASEGIVLKGTLAGVIDYSGKDPETGKHFMGTVIGTSDMADAKAITKVYTGYIQDAGNVEIKVQRDGLIVKVIYTQE